MTQTNRGPVGTPINLPTVDKGTNSRSENRAARSVGTNDGPTISAVPISSARALWNSTTDYLSELDDAFGMLAWWVVGSPAMGAPHGGDLEYGPKDSATEHIKNTAAYREAVQIYKEWLDADQPPGKFVNSLGTPSEYVADKGYFYVKGRAASGSDGGPRADWTQVFKHPLWGYTGQFSIRFTENPHPKEGYVNVEIENITSLPSYFHGIGSEELKVLFLEKLYTKRSGIPIASTSRQVYRFTIYVPRDSNSTGDMTYKVVSGDSLSAIAKALYGDMDLWPIIYERNRDTVGNNPEKIRVGQTLQIPAKDKLTPEQIKQAKELARRRRPGVISAPPLR